jgi:transcriptional regulator with XRE-family HTH domain
VANFADFVQEEMARRGWSQADLARESKVSRQVISYLLTGKVDKPDVETIRKFGDALDIPYEVIYRRAGLLPPKPPRDEWAESIATKINKLPADSRNMLENLIQYLYEQERKGKK